MDRHQLVPEDQLGRNDPDPDLGVPNQMGNTHNHDLSRHRRSHPDADADEGSQTGHHALRNRLSESSTDSLGFRGDGMSRLHVEQSWQTNYKEAAIFLEVRK